MLRCGTATGRVLRVHPSYISDPSSKSIPHLKRFASQWQGRGESSRAGALRGQKRLSNKTERAREEKETMREIQELRTKLATMDYRKEAETAGGGVVALDEDSLSVLYEAIKAPDPPTPEELRLEAKRRRMLQLGRGDQLDVLDASRGKSIALKLAILDQRLRDVHPINDLKEGEAKKTDLYQNLSTKLKNKGIFKGGREDEDFFHSPTEADELLQVSASNGQIILQNADARQQLLSKLQFLAQVLERNTTEQKVDARLTLPLGIATKQEWKALACAFAYANDVEGVQQVLKAVDHSGHGSCLIQVMNSAADVYAERGQVDECQVLLSWMNNQGLIPDDYTNHCLVKSYLRSGNLDMAVDVLHQLEYGKPASIATYSLVLQSLLSWTDNPAIQSRAWTLFQRMRLVAHPIPDAHCYAQMIKACAKGVVQPNEELWKPTSRLLAEGQGRMSSKAQSSRSSEAERALDLFREMTNRYNIRPTVEVYSALIAACVQRKDLYERGWQLFRSMVEMERARLANRSKEESLSFAPTREIFNSLLSGCAKNADLLRARWILAEMLRSATLLWKNFVSKEHQEMQTWELQEVENRRPDEVTITRLFFTYSNYHPPSIAIASKRENSPNRNRAATQGTGETNLKANAASESESVDEDVLTYNVPSTGRAILREVMSLMERIKIDYKQKGGLLSSVCPDWRLIESYMSVISRFCREADQVQHFREIISESKEGEVALIKQLDVEINGWIYCALLKYCSKLPQSSDVLSFTSEIWQEWIAMGGDGHLFRDNPREAKRLGLTTTCIASMWSYMIKVMAKHNRLDEAMMLMRKFAELYPPNNSAAPSYSEYASSSFLSSNHSISSNYYSLLNPLRGVDIRLLQQRTFDEPKLQFRPLEVLHHKLVERENRQEDIKYMTWLLRAYSSSSSITTTKVNKQSDSFQNELPSSTLRRDLQDFQPSDSTLQRSHG